MKEKTKQNVNGKKTDVSRYAYKPVNSDIYLFAFAENEFHKSKETTKSPSKNGSDKQEKLLTT